MIAPRQTPVWQPHHAHSNGFWIGKPRRQACVNTQDSQYGSLYAAWIVHFQEHIAMQVSKSNKLANVCYDIRGPVLKHAKRLEEEGHRILKLNIGNPAPFGFEAPDEILQDVIRNLPTAQGYSD